MFLRHFHNFRVARHPGTIPRVAANRLRTRALLHVADSATNWLYALAEAVLRFAECEPDGTFPNHNVPP
jgi:hypothetical protein